MQIEDEKNKEIYTQPYQVIDYQFSQNVHRNIDKQLVKLCQNEFKVVETREDKERKENALIKMNEILKTWMKKVNLLLDNKLDIENSYARLLCFGSYKLGVSSPSGDIDCIVLTPNYVDRDKHFFGDLYQILEENSHHNKNIKDLTSVNFTNSITPLIKLDFYGVQMDLLFANMDNVSQFDGQIMPSGIPKRPNLYNDYLMDHMDDKMKRSFNGFRNAEMILKSIFEQQDNQDEKKISMQLETYRVFLRCVKIFHKKKGIYENKFGYLGGISQAILTAKIFQLYPNYSAIQLLERYLYTYGYVWDWDNWKVNIVDDRPIPSDKKKPIIKIENQDELGQDIYFGKRKRFMEIMTPAWPQMSSTYNVSYSTRNAITQSYQKYQRIAEQKIMKCEDLQNNQEAIYEIWKDFFDEENFFQNYDQFIEFIIVGNVEEEYLKWKGFIEAKTRNFCEQVELLMNNFDFDMQICSQVFKLDEIKLKQPYEEFITKYTFSEKLYIGLKINNDYQNKIDLSHHLTYFLQDIEWKWQSENQIRNSEEIDFFIYLIDKDELSPEVLGTDIEFINDQDELNFTEKVQMTQLKQGEDVLNDLLD